MGPSGVVASLVPTVLRVDQPIAVAGSRWVNRSLIDDPELLLLPNPEVARCAQRHSGVPGHLDR